MKMPVFLLSAIFSFFLLTSVGATPPSFALTPLQAEKIPPALQEWVGWVLWEDTEWAAPPDYLDYSRRSALWPSALDLDLEQNGGTFTLSVEVFSTSWVPLPGEVRLWPREVLANGEAVAVVSRPDQAPAPSRVRQSGSVPGLGTPGVWLEPGQYTLTGKFVWDRLPQSLPVPASIGVLRLHLLGTEVAQPVWTAEGQLWLRRDRAVEEAAQDFLSVQGFGKLEDGIPLWLELEVELVVAGKSREERIGLVLPEGWRLASLQAPLPVAVSPEGLMKAQVRAGKWTVRLRAFRTDSVTSVQYAGGTAPFVENLLMGWQARPELRSVEIEGAPLVDVTQTSYPADWRNLPVVRWTTAQPLRLVERLRGPGERQAAPLTVQRQWWLDDAGRQFTFQDRVFGQRQEIWRLDAAPGQELGAVRAGEVGQLITRNPLTGAPGVEVRQRDLDLTATGTMARTAELPASGWLTETQNVRVDLNLPPGWRAVVIFGPDWVEGEWVASWSLLDLFLLLLFTLAVFRLFGFPASILAFVAFVLFCHEPGAPKILWLVALIPLALLRVVSAPRLRPWLVTLKWIIGGILLLMLIPFFSSQIQQALFPQLERVPPTLTGSATGFADQFAPAPVMAGEGFLSMESTAEADNLLEEPAISRKTSAPASPRASESKKNLNLLYESEARIQTGPGLPQWQWRSIRFGWNGPVSPTQTVDMVLLPESWQRVLTVLRLALILLLGWLFFRRTPGTALAGSPPPQPKNHPTPPPLPVTLGMAVLFLVLGSSASPATTANPETKVANWSGGREWPGTVLLDTLRERLLAAPPTFPGAAFIPSASLQMEQGRITLQTTIQTAAFVSVPLPIRLQDWSPVSVEIDGLPQPVLRRADGFLWVALEPGVHTVTVRGLLAATSEWQWSFLLTPAAVQVQASGWNVSGIGENGHPEAQIFFLRQEERPSAEAEYERQEMSSVLLVERELEVGQLWQVRTTVRRLTPTGRAVAIAVPLLPGEKVLTGNAILRDDRVEVRLGSQETTFSWNSEMLPAEKLTLQAMADGAFVERWRLLVSPVWNVTTEGLAPLFTETGNELLPEWQPWPGESVTWHFQRPEPVPGATVTVQSVRHETTVGQRQRTNILEVALRASLGEDFSLRLPEGARVTELTHQGRALPVRQTEGRLVVPLRPGEQTLKVAWQTTADLPVHIAVEAVELSAPSANVSTILNLPEDRWVLWAAGPVRGPAVRFWVVVAGALLAALVLGRIPGSPLRTWQWALLGLGLTQVPYPVALVVVGWLFLLVWRGNESFSHLPRWAFRLGQVVIPLLTFVVLLVFLGVVAAGLLGSPQMFVAGNGSSPFNLQWFEATAPEVLPQPSAWAISEWWYRLFMLSWALWLAVMLLRWLQWGWKQYGQGGYWKR